MHGAATEEVQVEVVDGLAAIVAGVDDQAVAVGEGVGAGEIGGDGGEMAEEGSVVRGGVGERGEVLLGDDEDVSGGLRVDVGEGEGEVVLVEAGGGDGAGDDLAEEAVWIRLRWIRLRHAEILSPASGGARRGDSFECYREARGLVTLAGNECPMSIDEGP